MSYLGEWEERCLARARRRAASAAASCGSRICTCSAGSASRARASAASPTSSAARCGAAISRSSPSSPPSSTRGSSATRRGSPRRSRWSRCRPASPSETAQLLLHEVRALEVRLKDVALHPFVPRTALELGAALFPWRARPGVAIEIVRRVAEDAAARDDATRARRRTTCSTTSRARPGCRREPDHARRSRSTPTEVEAAFAARVIGQPAATRAAADVDPEGARRARRSGPAGRRACCSPARPAPARPSSRPRSPSTCTAISRGSCASTWASCRAPTRSRA